MKSKSNVAKFQKLVWESRIFEQNLEQVLESERLLMSELELVEFQIMEGSVE